MHGEELSQPGDFEYLANEASQAADPERTAAILQLFGNRHEGAQADAADVGEFSQIDDDGGKAIRNAGFACRFELRSTLDIHAAGHAQNCFTSNLDAFNVHDYF